VTSIAEMKERGETATPVLLFECSFPDGRVERWATHRVTANQVEYDPRVISHSAFELRQPGEDSIDSTGRVSVVVSNVDGRISQLDRTVGFKGARLLVRFGFFDLESGQAETPLAAIYSGTGQPLVEAREDSACLTFIDRFSLTRILQPTARIQPTCPWKYPKTEEERAEASGGGEEGRYSPLWKCGYSPDQPGGCGNLNGGTVFSDCGRTAADCKERGMYFRDSNGRPTARFGGFTYLPPSILVRTSGEKSYRWSGSIEGKARSNDPLPLLYGTVWIRAMINFARSDGNLTYYELILSTGQVNRVIKVLADGMEIPPGTAGSNMTGTGWFNIVSDGNRNGGLNPFFRDATGSPEGDPHGSIAVLVAAIPNKLLSGNATPKFEVLAEGSILPRFDEDGTELPAMFTSNPAWIVLDLMRRSGWHRHEIDFSSFARAAQYCDELIQIIDENGSERQIPRFELNFALTERKPLIDIIRGIKLSTGLSPVLSATGHLSLHFETGIARQCANKKDTSNAAAPLGSGWPAYEFGDGTDGRSGILVQSGRSTLRFWRKSGNETPNRLTVELQDSFRGHQQTSVSIVDAEDEALQGHEIAAALPALGLPHTDQALRAIRLQLDKTLRGNRFAEFYSGLQAVGIRPGDLITLTVLSEGLHRSLFRVLSVSLGTNHSTVRIVCRAHAEEWYSRFESGGTSIRGISGFEYDSGVPRVLPGKVLSPDGSTELEIEEGAEDLELGRVALTARFTPPRKRPVSRIAPPAVALTARVIEAAGGLNGPKQVYYGLTSFLLSGAESPLSFLVRADLPGGTANSAVEIKGISAPGGADGIYVYRGNHPMELYRIATLTSSATSFIDHGNAAELETPADPNYDKAEILWRFELLPEVAATIWTESSIGRQALGLAPDVFEGSVVRISGGKGRGQERRILSHTADEILIEGRWEIIPDATSRFSIVEPSWKSGGTSTTEEVSFHVPARFGERLELIARAVSPSGRSCPLSLCPITIHNLRAGREIDSDVPSEPVFSLTTGTQSEVVVSGIGLEKLENSFSITAGILSLYYWDEMRGPSPYHLSEPLDENSSLVSLDPTSGFAIGQYIQAGRELMLVTGVHPDGIEVERARFHTEATSHAAGSTLWLLAVKTSTMSFPRGFFGSPASGAFSHRVTLPNARIAAAELTLRNRYGNSPTAQNEFLGTREHGMRTVEGSQLTIQLMGIPAVENSIAPPLPVPHPAAIYDFFAAMSVGPIGGDLVVRVRTGMTELARLIVADGNTWSNTVSGFGIAPLAEGDQIEVDILEAPTGQGTHPGRDLTVAIRL